MDYKKMKKSEVVEAAKVFEGSLRHAEDKLELQRSAFTWLQKELENQKSANAYLRKSTEFAEEQARNKGAKVELGKNILRVMKANHVGITIFGWTFIFMAIPESLAKVARLFRTMDALDSCPPFRIEVETGEATKV